MIHDENNPKLGGPNADVPQRIKTALQKPGIPQPTAVSVQAQRDDEYHEFVGKHLTPPHEFDPLNCVFCHRIQMIERRRELDFPPKYIYENIEFEKQKEIIAALTGEPIPDWTPTFASTGEIPECSDSEKFSG